MKKYIFTLLCATLLCTKTCLALVTWEYDAAGYITLDHALIRSNPGAYTYEFTVTNVGSVAPITLLTVYTRGTVSHSTHLAYSDWGGFWLNSVPPYLTGPAGEINLALTSSSVSYGSKTDSSRGLQQGASVSGFTLTTSILQDSFSFAAFKYGDYERMLNNSIYFTYGSAATAPSSESPITAVPEPSTYGLLGAGALGLLGFARRFRRRQA